MKNKPNIVPSSGKFVKVNNINIYYEECGKGETLILLHGGTATISMWKKEVISKFAKYFRVITPDSRGHGKTDNPKKEMNYQLMADDTAAFIKVLGIDKPFVCGYSDGGQVALELGIRYPGLCRGLVIGATWFKMSNNYKKILKNYGFTGKGRVDIDYIEKGNPGTIKAWKREHVDPNNPEKWKTMLQEVSVMWWTPLSYSRPDFKKIKDPSLILMGDRDGFIPIEQALQMYKFIAGAELAILPNTTHASAFQKPELFIKTVLDFLLRNVIKA